MLRWAVLAITHVFSQAKPLVAPSLAQTMCDESIISSRKVSRVKKNPKTFSLVWTTYSQKIYIFCRHCIFNLSPTQKLMNWMHLSKSSQNWRTKSPQWRALTFRKALVWWSAWGLYKVHSRMAAIWGKFVLHILHRRDFQYLKKEYDDKKDAIGSEKNAGLFEGATVTEDGDDQDEGANCN